MTKKRKINSQQSFSEKSYLKSGQARKLPIYECYVLENWEETQKTHVIIARQHKNSHVTIAFFLADLLCAGVKDAWYLFNISMGEYRSVLERFDEMEDLELESCDYIIAHNIIYGALDYAAECGIEPPESYRLASMILDEDTEDIPLIELPLGIEGKPCLTLFPDDPRQTYYLKQLQKNVGEGNFMVISEDPDDYDYDDYDDDLYDDHEDWERNDWEDFLLTLKEGELMLYPIEGMYIFEKCIFDPGLAGRQLGSAGQTVASEIKITFDPINNQALSKAELKAAQEIYEAFMDPEVSNAKLKSLIKDIDKSMNKWPENPMFYNYLYNVHLKLNNKKTSDKIIIEMIEKFPDYHFAKIIYANSLLDKGKYEDVPKVFNNNLDLASAFPEKKEFHISEFVTFNTLMCRYFMEKQDLISAVMYKNMIDDLEVSEIANVNHKLFLRLDFMLLAEVEELTKEVKSNEDRKNEVLTLLVN
jgi:hypothetical protein